MINFENIAFKEELCTIPNSVRRAVISTTNEAVIVHTLSMFNYLTKNVLGFIKEILSLQNIKIPGIIPIVGISIENTTIYVIYKDLGFEKVSFSTINEDEKRNLLLNVAKSLYILHSLGSNHLNIKINSFFRNSSGEILLGCMQPPVNAIYDQDDEELPFYECPPEFRDVFLFGLFSEELLFGVKRTVTLKKIWNYETKLSTDSLLNECLELSPKKRPSFEEIFEKLGGDKEDLKKLEIHANKVTDEEILDAVSNVPCLYGSCYIYPFATKEQNLTKAKEIFEKSDDPISLNNLSKLILNEDQASSIKAMMRAAAQNFNVAEKNAGIILLQNKEVKKGVALLERAVSHGNHEALLILEDIYLQKNKDKALMYVTRAAHHGDTKALVNLGLFHEHAWGTQQSFTKMSGNWALAIRIGSEQAINNIGVHFASIEESLKLWENIKDPVAYFNIANYYIHKEGEERREMGIELMRKSAECGYIPAMFNMATILKESNPEEADMWCKKASEARTEELVISARMKEISEEATK